MNDFNGALNKSLDEFMEYYKMVDTEEIYSNGTEFVPIFRVKQWEEYNNNEIERLNNDIKILLKENESKEKVILKYNNIINELKKWLEDKDKNALQDDNYWEVLDKLQELKGVDKE